MIVSLQLGDAGSQLVGDLVERVALADLVAGGLARDLFDPAGRTGARCAVLALALGRRPTLAGYGLGR